MTIMKISLIRLAVLDIFILIVGMLLPRITDVLKPFTDPIFVITGATLAIVTYFGFLELQNTAGKGWTPKQGSTRIAITSAILVVYFFVLSFSLFMHIRAESTSKELPIMDTLVTSFTTIVGIIVPFYFGASAYVQTHTPAQKDQQEQNEGA